MSALGGDRRQLRLGRVVSLLLKPRDSEIHRELGADGRMGLLRPCGSFDQQGLTAVDLSETNVSRTQQHLRRHIGVQRRRGVRARAQRVDGLVRAAQAQQHASAQQCDVVPDGVVIKSDRVARGQAFLELSVEEGLARRRERGSLASGWTLIRNGLRSHNLVHGGRHDTTGAPPTTVIERFAAETNDPLASRSPQGQRAARPSYRRPDSAHVRTAAAGTPPCGPFLTGIRSRDPPDPPIYEMMGNATTLGFLTGSRTGSSDDVEAVR